MKTFLKFFMDTDIYSMMRLLSFMLVSSGILILFAGIPLDIILDVNKITGQTGQNLTPIITAGLSVIGMGLGAKAVQKVQEIKTEMTEIQKNITPEAPTEETK